MPVDEVIFYHRMNDAIHYAKSFMVVEYDRAEQWLVEDAIGSVDVLTKVVCELLLDDRRGVHQPFGF